MGDNMGNELHLPWNNDTLEQLLLNIIKIGETTKVDFKKTLNLETYDQKAELLKDISALANTYDENYFDYGFIILGVEQNQFIGVNFQQKVDNLQSQIDDLIKTYIAPFIKTHVLTFTNDNKILGVIVVPPTRNAPHVFIRDIGNKHRGDIYVRRGTITEKALPEDFALFFRHHLEEYTYTMRQEIKDIQLNIEKIKKDLFDIKSSRTSGTVEEDTDKAAESLERKSKTHRRKSTSLIQEIEETFASEEDHIKYGLIKEAKKIQSFLESNFIPWDLQVPSKEGGKELFSTIEKEAETYWIALSKILIRDDKGKYDEAIIQSLGYLARYYEPPSGITFTHLGQNIRYYPLVVSLYIIFIIGAFKKKLSLLKAISNIKLMGRSVYSEPLSIAYSLFFIRGARDVFQTQHENYPNSRWCEPVASYIKILIDQKVYIDDYIWDKDANFYIGEFLLSLLPLNIVDQDTGKPINRMPSSGLYIYIGSAIPSIRRFLRNERSWIEKIFSRPFGDILKEFDETAIKNTNILCTAAGFVSGAFESAFPEKRELNN